MERLTAAVLAHRRLVSLAWVVIAVAGMWASATITDSLSQSFTAPGRPAFDANREILRTARSGGVVPPIVLAGRDPAVVAKVAGAVRGGRIAEVGERGGLRATLVFPPPGRPAPDKNLEATAAAAAAARGTGVAVTGIDALAQDTGGGAGVLVETLLGGLGALVVLISVFASVAALVPILIAIVSILGSFLVLRGLAAITEISFVVQFIVALIGLGVAIDYSLLVIVRWREERDRGATGDDAILTAMRHAGRAVVFSGTTVAVGLLALVVVPVPAIRSIGYGGLLIPLVSVLASVTLLPVLLHSAGDRLNWPRARRAPSEGRRWRAWSQLVVRRRWPAAVAGLALLIVLTAFATTLNPGSPKVSALAASGAPRAALGRLERAGFGPGLLTPIEVIGGKAADFGDIDGVQAVADAGATLAVLPRADAATDAGKRTLDAIRAEAQRRDVRAGGSVAQTADLTDAIYGSFVPMLLLIAVITFVLLARAFRSVVLPLKAIALNVLSVGASFGVIVIVWQAGHGAGLFGIDATGAITNWVPLAMFAFLFGLSMDYEVFILSRMRESYDEHADTDRAVVDGLGATGRLVTSAALILFLAFVAMGAAPGTEIKIFATGLAAGIILDATVVRALIVPALVTLLGRVNWTMPRGLARLLHV